MAAGGSRSVRTICLVPLLESLWLSASYNKSADPSRLLARKITLHSTTPLDIWKNNQSMLYIIDEKLRWKKNNIYSLAIRKADPPKNYVA
jgi:hypothetical protein